LGKGRGTDELLFFASEAIKHKKALIRVADVFLKKHKTGIEEEGSGALENLGFPRPFCPRPQDQNILWLCPIFFSDTKQPF
jgi:hypothetical protein